MWSSLKLWLVGISKNVWDFVFPILKSEVMKFAVAMKPVIEQAIKDANAKTDLDNKGKFEFVKGVVEAAAKQQVATYKDSWINLAIELVYTSIKTTDSK